MTTLGPGKGKDNRRQRHSHTYAEVVPMDHCKIAKLLPKNTSVLYNQAASRGHGAGHGVDRLASKKAETYAECRTIILN